MPTPDPDLFVANNLYDRAMKQLGTLGGGNHFIEIQKGSDGHIWIMIHSGSRYLGKRVGDHYNKIAETLDYITPTSWQLSALSFDSPEGKAYFREMRYCERYAFANRQLMMERVKESFEEIIPEVSFMDFINIPHNYASEEIHFGEKVIVHRKGAHLCKKR